MVILTVAFFLPALAVIVTLPFFLAFTRPFLLTVAIFLLLVLHLTLSVLFLGVTVAFNVFFAPFFMVNFALPLIFTLVAGEVTLTVTVWVLPLVDFTVIVVLPVFRAVTLPFLSTLAILEFLTL